MYWFATLKSYFKKVHNKSLHTNYKEYLGKNAGQRLLSQRIYYDG